MHLIRTIIKAIFLLTAFLLLAFLLINAFDEDLNAEIAPFTDFNNIAPSDDKNAYFHLMGMPAPVGSRPHESGKALVYRANKIAEERGLAAEPDLWEVEKELFGKKRVEIQGNVSTLCSPREKPCLDTYIKNKNNIRKLIANNQVLFNRAKHLRGYPHYSERQGTELDFPIAQYSKALPRLYLADAALKAHSGQLSRALTILENDARFWRMMLGESHTMIGKMIAVAYLDHTVSLTSELTSR